MHRTVRFELNNVSPIPHTLREVSHIDLPGAETTVNLGQLFLQQYFDSFPSGPPKTDPTRFEYLDLVSGTEDFRFHSFVSEASTVKKRTISTELGQAFCRLLLHDHFDITYFAHLRDVIGKSTHSAFNGLKIERAIAGDVPDYLCARSVTKPMLAEAKGRFTSIGFSTEEFRSWRNQFTRVRIVDRQSITRKLKGFVCGTRFITDANSEKMRSCVYLEDPEIPGESQLDAESATSLARAIMAIHYGRIFSKLGLSNIASALTAGYSLTRQLTFPVTVWECLSEPLQGKMYVGGWYRTAEGPAPSLTKTGWLPPMELGCGHLAFVGLELNIAQMLARAARGSWNELHELPKAEPNGRWSSELAWLYDGTVTAPAQQFLPRDVVTL